jgi:dihydrolipoamide dehydrogenase
VGLPVFLKELPFLKFDEKKILSSTGALELTEVPKHLVVVGGGIIGLEMGSVWSRLGAKVTVVEFQNRLTPGVDAQMSEELRKTLVKQGFEFKLAHKCLGAKQNGNWLNVEIEEIASGNKSTLEADYVLVSTGRRPYTANLGLETIGLTTDKGGKIAVQSNWLTSVPGVYAVGDVIDGPMLAHKATDEAVACVETLTGHKAHVNYWAIPNVLYTWPELAAVGMTEEDAKQRNIPTKIGTFPYMVNGRAKAMEETEGLVKVIANAQTGHLLGVHILGARAGEMIHEAVMVMEFGGKAADLGNASHAHPTLSEIVKEAALSVDKRQVHL